MNKDEKLFLGVLDVAPITKNNLINSQFVFSTEFSNC
jgi:hypothetical protein